MITFCDCSLVWQQLRGNSGKSLGRVGIQPGKELSTVIASHAKFCTHETYQIHPLTKPLSVLYRDKVEIKPKKNRSWLVAFWLRTSSILPVAPSRIGRLVNPVLMMHCTCRTANLFNRPAPCPTLRPPPKARSSLQKKYVLPAGVGDHG